MKNFVFTLATVLCCCIATQGQPNNPYNQWGAQVVSAALAIHQDYLDGKTDEINQDRLDAYFKTFFPDQKAIQLEEFTKIVGIMKAANNESIIELSGYSEEGKKFLHKTLTDQSVTEQVKEVLQSQLSEKEKQGVLSILAVNYNLIKPLTKIHALDPKGKGPSSWLTENTTARFELSEKPFASLILGGIGYLVGSSLFSSTAAVVATTVVGIVAGGILGERTGTRTSVSTWSAGSGGSGGFNPPQP